MKTPNIESAATTARVLSRLLKKAGFLMANTKNRYVWTEGINVSRVGVSNYVNISYHIPQNQRYSQDARARMQEAMNKLKDFLKEKGYPIDPNTGWIICQKSD